MHACMMSVEGECLQSCFLEEANGLSIYHSSLFLSESTHNMMVILSRRKYLISCQKNFFGSSVSLLSFFEISTTSITHTHTQNYDDGS